jgi:hypothetical protein
MAYRVVLDDEVIAKAKEGAEPLVDSVNSVIRRALGLGPVAQEAIFYEIEELAVDEPVESPAASAERRQPAPRRSQRRKGRAKAARAPKGSLLDERAYWQPILAVLADSPNGAAPAREVIAKVGDMVDDQLTDLDRAEVASGGERWQGRVQFARLRMKDAGLLEPDSPRGVWQISKDGRRAVARTGADAA